MRKSDYPKVHWLGAAGLAILLLSLLLFGAFAPAAMAADWPRCVDGCSANDVEVNRIWLEVPGNCTPGYNVTADVWMNLYFHRQNTYCIVVVADLYEAGGHLQSNWTSSIISYHYGGGNYSYNMGNISWTCGKTFEMRNILVMWRQQTPGVGGCSGNCTDYTTPSKCTKQPSIIVVTPLVADFEFTTVCYCTYTQFTNETTGGLPQYTFDWDFGDGTPHNITENPSHHYNAAGTYNVTLTVNDSDSPQNTDSQSYDVTVWPTPVADFTTNPPQQIYCLPFTFNGSAIGGTPDYNYSWDFNDSSPTSYGQDQSHTYTDPGTYNVTLTVNDSHNCTNSTIKPVVALNYTAELNVNKTANETGPFNVNDIINYTINVTNKGTVNVTGITVNDSKLSLSSNIGTLTPGQSHFLYPSYTVTQQDACNASITNTANASGTSICLTPVYAEDTETVPTVYLARLAVNKTANETGPFNVNDIINYTINVTNKGTVNVTGITVNDSKLSLSSNIGTLTPGQSHFLYPSYTVTQQDACNASITNTANASGTSICLTPVYAEDTETVPTVYNSSISINKTGSTHGPVAPGDTIDYWIKVCNTGNLTLYNATVNDSRFGTKDLDTLTTGACKWFNTTYNVTQQDVCKPIVNYANVTAVDYCNNTRSGGPVSWTVTTKYNASIAINKTASLNGTCPGSDPLNVSIGDTVTYCFNVTNTGDVNLTSITVNNSIYGLVLATPFLAPGESTGGTVTHTVLVSDEPSVTNIATANGTNPCGDTVNDTDDCTIIVNIHPDVELEKTSSPAIVAPGGTVTYTIKYKNTGTETLHNVVITEHYPNGVTFISASPAPDPGTNNVWTIRKLEPGESRQIVIKVKVPEPIDLSFTETGSVIGEGLVMVTKDLSTEQKPYSLRNRVTLSCDELAPVSAFATTKVSGVPGTSLGITESGSGVYSSDEILDLETKNKSIILKKSTHAEYKPTSFNFSDSFSVNFTNKWKQDICSRNMEIDAAIHKKISDATYIDDETISRVDKDKSVMNFVSSFNGSMYIGARTKDIAISETYIGEFDVLQTIHIGKGPIPTPMPTPTPIWLPCPYNASPEMNMTEDAEPTP